MSKFQSPTREVQLNQDASGEAIPIPKRYARRIVQNTGGDSEPARAGYMLPARTQATSECIAGWPERYLHKLASPEEALKLVKSGSRVYIGGGCGEPVELAQNLVWKHAELKDVEIIHVLTSGHAAYSAPGMESSFRVNSLFIGSNVRGAVQEGRADFTPVFLHEIPTLFREGYLPIDVALISVSPPDQHGFCSYGVEVGVTKPAVDSARVVIAEINPNMPRVWGQSFIHLSQITYCVPVDYPLPTAPLSAPTPTHEQIGRHIAGLINDGDTLQIGIGSIPDAVLRSLGDKRDLGVHSEMFSDGIVDLVERGVITGRRKNFLPGKVVAAFMLGTERLYRFVHDNPMIEMRPVDFTEYLESHAHLWAVVRCE